MRTGHAQATESIAGIRKLHFLRWSCRRASSAAPELHVFAAMEVREQAPLTAAVVRAIGGYGSMMLLVGCHRSTIVSR